MTNEQLKKCYIQAAEAFYNGKPLVMSDREYDELEKKVLSIYPDFDIKTYITFHQQGATIQHHAHLPSADKSADESRNWNILNSYGDFVTTKYDGCSIIAYYRDGEPYQIVTRSNDVSGKNQFDKLINKVLHHVDKDITEIYYEATTNLSVGDRGKANGLINSKYKQEEVDKYLTLNPFGCWSENKDAVRKFMQSFVRLISKEEMQFIIDNGQLPDGTPADGVVSFNVENNSLMIRKIYNNGSAYSKITGHRMTFSDSTLTQSVVCKIEKVFLDGANISNVKMGPINTIKKLGLGLGAEVEVIRTKKVIPYIQRVVKPSNDFSDIKCSCGHELITVGQDLFCRNPECYLMNKAMTERFCTVLFPEKTFAAITNKNYNNDKFLSEIKAHIETLEHVDTLKQRIATLGASEVFYLIKIPRFDIDKKIRDIVTFERKVKSTDTLKEKIALFLPYCSDLQKELVKLYLERLYFVLSGLNLQLR